MMLQLLIAAILILWPVVYTRYIRKPEEPAGYMKALLIGMACWGSAALWLVGMFIM